MPLAPALLELEEIVHRVLTQEPVEEQALVAQLSGVRSFLLESVGIFREVEDTLQVDDEGQQKLELCSQEMSFSLEALDKLQDALLQKKLYILKDRLSSFLSARTRCLDFIAEFSSLAQRQPIYSPVPVYDAFIKAGFKVAEGRLPKERLQERFPGLMPELDRARRLVNLLPKLHQTPNELVAALQSGLSGLEAGYGALAQYFAEDKLEALHDGLKLIGSSSTILGAQFQKAEEVAGQTPRYTKFRPLEEWLRLKNYLISQPDDAIPEAWIVATVSQVFFVWDYLLSQAEWLRQNPVLQESEMEESLTEGLMNQAIEARIAADKSLATLSGDALLKGPNELWIAPVPVLESLLLATERCHKLLESKLEPFKELPGLERIVYLKHDVKRGKADKALLRQELTTQLKRVEELIDSVRDGRDPISREFDEVLPLHRGAYIGMLDNLEADDWDGLEARWQGILSTLSHLADLSRAVRQRLAAQSSTSKLIRCLRCEATNPPERRVCSSCGANLPTVVQRGQTFEEIDLDEGSATQAAQPATLSPRAIDLLESLVRGVVNNQTNIKDAAEALQLLIDDLNRQRQMFSKKLVPLMGKDQTLDAYLRVFAQALGTYFTTLMNMHEAVTARNVPGLEAGLGEAREILEAIDELKARIDEALRG